jgi:putative colanic acid biosynthesis acetyltransferase WcaF
MTAILPAEKNKPLEGGASFSLSHRLERLAWNVAWAVLASWTPPAMRRWRLAVLRLFGAQVAPTASVYGSARIWYPRNLELGVYACIGPRARIYSMGRITLGAYALVSQGAHLCAGSHDIEDRHFQLLVRSIVVGDRAWLAAECFVGPGVTVGNGAVLGARAVAMRDLDAWTVYRGNPATAVRPRRIRFSSLDEMP